MTGARMKRVMIVGQPGSGKSTLARRLGERTGLPVFHIDRIHWMPGWVERPRDEKTAMCLAVHAREEWIFEGGHSVTWPDRLRRCDTLIWLDYPLVRRLWRVTIRTLRHYGRTRPDLPEGCPEQFNRDFYRWIWDTRTTARANIAKLIADAPAGKAIHRLRGDRAVARFLASVPGRG